MVDEAFLSVAAHKLRQPLHALTLYRDAMVGEANEATRQRLHQGMRSAIRELGGLYATLLEISRLDSGQVSPHVTDMPVKPFLERLIGDFNARAHGIALRVQCPDDVTIRSDPVLLGRILSRLLDNAVCCTEQGDVRIVCRRDGKRMCIEVRDSGPGVPEDQKERFFSDFFQMHHGCRQGHGAGLGLGVVRRLAVLLGYSLRVESDADRGTCVSIEIDTGMPQSS